MEVNPPAGVKVRVWLPLPAMERLVKVATPATAVAVTVPPNTPLPVAIVAVTIAVEVTVLPVESTMRTTGWVVKADPDTAPAG